MDFATTMAKESPVSVAASMEETTHVCTLCVCAPGSPPISEIFVQGGDSEPGARLCVCM